MNPITHSIVSGGMFFVGMALVLTMTVLLLRCRHRPLRSHVSGLAIVGIILVVASATPLPMWAYAIWMVPAVTGLIRLHSPDNAQRRSIGWVTLLALTTIALCFTEANFQRAPIFFVPAEAAIYVLGDSISSGIGTEHGCWPNVLGELLPQQVVNLAQPAATVKDAIIQAAAIAEPRAAVIVEIGGNDLLGDTDAATFRAQLDTLLLLLRSYNHDVLLFELPLFPFQNAYGKAQRELARKHGVTLLPKRFFARVLAVKNGTLDGLHLSTAGHAAMARIVADICRSY